MEKINIHSFVCKGYSIISYVPQIQWRENCYLLIRGLRCIIIDPGFECEGLVDYIRSKNYDVECIFFTHAHYDHIASAQLLSESFSVSCIVHPSDKRLLMHAPMYSMRFAQRDLQRPRQVMWLDENLEKEIQRAYGIDILHTPGHTAGGICLAYKESLFTGDTLVKGYLGRTDLPEGNRKEILRSVGDVFKYIQNRTIEWIYPGHGTIWEIDAARNWWENSRGKFLEQKTFDLE